MAAQRWPKPSSERLFSSRNQIHSLNSKSLSYADWRAMVMRSHGMQPDAARVGACDGDVEHHLPEGAVMVAFAMHLLRTVPGLRQVSIHPDGEHGKQFDFRGWLRNRGFTMIASAGKRRTAAPMPRQRDRRSLSIRVRAAATYLRKVTDLALLPNARAGSSTPNMPGRQSRLRQGLCETVGLSLASPVSEGRRQFARTAILNERRLAASAAFQRAD